MESAELQAMRDRIAALEAAMASQAEREQAQSEALGVATEHLGRIEEERQTAARAPTMRPLASIFARFERREGNDALSPPRPLTTGCSLADSDCLRFRARVGVEVGNLRLGESGTATLRFLPELSGHWGMTTFALGGPGVGSSSSGGNADALLGVHEAVLQLAFGDTWKVELGRFELSYGDQVVLGALDWHPGARAFDGARLRYTSDVSLDVFGSILNEGHRVSLVGGSSPAPLGQGDQWLVGAYVGLGRLLNREPTTAFDVYLIGQQSHNRAEGMSEREWSMRSLLGTRFRSRWDVVDVRAEGGFQFGREGALRDSAGRFGASQAVAAGFVLGEVGLNLLENKLRLGLEGNFASGDNPTTTDVVEGYYHYFPTAHAFLGLSDVYGARTNMASGVFHAMARPVETLAISLDWHVFIQPERGIGSSNFAGQEADVQALWTPFDGLRVRGMFALVLPETAYFRAPGSANYDTSPATFLELEVGYVLR